MTGKTTNPETIQKPSADRPMLVYCNVLAVGIYLGIFFSKTEVARWQRIHHIFLFLGARLYLIICPAIVVAML